MLHCQAISLSPLGMFASTDSDPIYHSHTRYFRPLPPMIDEVDDFIPLVWFYPTPLQLSPRFFFNLICSSINSDSTSALRWSFCSSCTIFCSCSVGLVFSFVPFENTAAPLSNSCFCQ